MLLHFNLSFDLYIHGVSNALFQLVSVEQEGLSSVEMAQKQWHVPAFHLAGTVAKESTEDRDHVALVVCSTSLAIIQP